VLVKSKKSNIEYSFYNRKIRNKLLLLVLGSTAFVLFGLAFATYYNSFQILYATTEEKSHDEVEIAVKNIESWIALRRGVTEMIAKVESRNSISDVKQQLYLQDIASVYSAKSIYIAKQNDGSLVSSDQWEPPEEWDARKREWYIDAVNAKSSIVSTPYTDDSPPYEKIITIASAIRERGKVKGVVALDTPINSILSILNDLKVGKYSRAFLIDSSNDKNVGEIIYGEKKNDLINSRFLKDFISSDVSFKSYVDDQYRMFSRIGDSNLIIVFHLPVSEVHSQLERLTRVFGFGILAALAILGIAVACISTLIARPILSLAEGTLQVASGNYEFRLPITTKDELGLVTDRFNLMAEELKEKEVIRNTFERYVSPEAVEEILSGKTALGGEKKLVSVLISDLRGFTEFSDNNDPEYLVELLNKYFTLMEGIIRKHGGSINRYLGDGIFALFGAPNILENSALSSVQAGIEMRMELRSFNKEHGTSFDLGIGINTGVAIVGNIGSLDHTEYTVIGDAANLASRIESLTKVYGESILIADSSAALLPKGMFNKKLIDKVRVLGMTEPVVIYSVNEITFDSEDDSAVRQIVDLYLNGKFDQAMKRIKMLDSHLRNTHIDLIFSRCKEMVELPQSDWDGAYTMTHK